jgi:hypothetical protein
VKPFLIKESHIKACNHFRSYKYNVIRSAPVIWQRVIKDEFLYIRNALHRPHECELPKMCSFDVSGAKKLAATLVAGKQCDRERERERLARCQPDGGGESELAGRNGTLMQKELGQRFRPGSAHICSHAAAGCIHLHCIMHCRRCSCS